MNPATRLAVALGAAALAAGVALHAAQAPAQQPPSAKGIVPKGRAPVSTTVLQVKLPRAKEATLTNGLRVMVLEDHRAPQVTFQLIIPGAGGYFDPADHAGLAQFTAAMLREGTATRSAQQIAEQLERLAASLTVSSGPASEDAVVTGSALSAFVDPLVDLTADIVLAPAFPEQELTRYKAQTRAQLVQQRSQPGFLAQERFSKVIAGDHPAGRVSPTVESLDKTTREALASFHKAHYVPDHALIAFVGDISLADAVSRVEARFATWKKAGVPAPQVSDPVPLGGPGIFLVARPNSVQTSLVVGMQAISRTDPDFYPLTVLNKVVGGGPTGRLFRHLREDKGYTYGAYSNLAGARFRGAWQASTDVRTEVTGAALTDLLDELRQVRESRIPDQEFGDAKRALVAAFALELESPSALLGDAVTIWRYKLPADYWDRYPERVMAVTADQVQAVAKKYFDPARVQVVAVGSRDAVAPVLEKLGPVETYDTEGKRVGK